MDALIFVVMLFVKYAGVLLSFGGGIIIAILILWFLVLTPLWYGIKFLYYLFRAVRDISRN